MPRNPSKQLSAAAGNERSLWEWKPEQSAKAKKLWNCTIAGIIYIWIIYMNIIIISLCITRIFFSFSNVLYHSHHLTDNDWHIFSLRQTMRKWKKVLINSSSNGWGGSCHPRQSTWGPQTPDWGSVCLDRLLLVVLGLLPEPQTHCHSAQVCRSESHSNMRKRGDTVAVATNQRWEGGVSGWVGVCVLGRGGGCKSKRKTHTHTYTHTYTHTHTHTHTHLHW